MERMVLVAFFVIGCHSKGFRGFTFLRSVSGGTPDITREIRLGEWLPGLHAARSAASAARRNGRWIFQGNFQTNLPRAH